MTKQLRKSPPPILYILLALGLIFGWHQFTTGDGQQLSQVKSESPNSLISPLAPRFSLGNRLLIAANATNYKQQGIAAFSKQNYEQAKQQFEHSLRSNPNDPETLIYFNNASVAYQQPVKIAAVVPIGSNLDVAQEMLRGIAQAQSEFNLQGGKLQIQIINDENNPKIAAQVAEELVKDSSILAVIGSNASNASLAGAKIYQQHGLVMITPTSTSEQLSNLGSYVFRTAPTNSEMADTLAEYAIDIIKRKNVAICYDSQAPDNVTFKDAFIPALLAKGGNYINTQCDFAAPDFNADNSVSQLISSGAEAVLLAPHIDKLNRVIDLARANDWKMAMLGTFSLNTAKITQSGQGDLNGVVLPVPFHAQQESAQDFTAKAYQTWGNDTMLTWRTATSYDAAKAIASSLKQNPTRNGIQNLLRQQQLTIEGANSQVQFLPTGDRLITSTLVKVKATPERGYYFELVSSN